MSTKITTKKQVEQLLNDYDTFLFDCDGVLWQGSHLLPKVNETISMLHERGKQLIFVTNNSTKSRRTYQQKFEKFGLQVSADEIFCSAYSAAVYLDKVVKFPKDKKVFVVGEAGIEEELASVGIKTIGGTDPNFKTEPSEEAMASVERNPEVGCVLAGLDTHINYYKIAYAQQQLNDPSTLFLATNIDTTFPTKGKLLPGAGTIIQSIAACSGREPAAALGKPSDQMMDTIKAKFHFDPSRAIMVGDRLNTDMVFGDKGGLGTLFVLTGVDTEQAIAKDPIVTPKYFANKLGDLYELLN